MVLAGGGYREISTTALGREFAFAERESRRSLPSLAERQVICSLLPDFGQLPKVGFGRSTVAGERLLLIRRRHGPGLHSRFAFLSRRAPNFPCCRRGRIDSLLPIA